MPEEHPMFMDNGDTWNSIKFNIDYDATERISEFLNDVHKISTNERKKFYSFYKIPKFLGKSKWKVTYASRLRCLLLTTSYLIRDTRFWCSQFEFQIFQRFFNIRIYSLQAETRSKTKNIDKEREWSLLLKGDNFDLGNDLPIIENNDGRFCFLSVVGETHFLSVKTQTKQLSILHGQDKQATDDNDVEMNKENVDIQSNIIQKSYYKRGFS